MKEQNAAIVEFQNTISVQRVIQKKPIMYGDFELDVQPFVPGIDAIAPLDIEGINQYGAGRGVGMMGPLIEQPLQPIYGAGNGAGLITGYAGQPLQPRYGAGYDAGLIRGYAGKLMQALYGAGMYVGVLSANAGQPLQPLCEAGNALGMRGMAETPSLPPYSRELAAKMREGSRVVRGRDWCDGVKDGGGEGKITSLPLPDISEGFVHVRWDNRALGDYRMGKDGRYKLNLAPCQGHSSRRNPAAASYSVL